MYLTRIDKSAPLGRFYRMDIQPGLFEEWALVREWGKVGKPGQSRTDWYDSEAEAKSVRFDVHMQKAKMGYE